MEINKNLKDSGSNCQLDTGIPDSSFDAMERLSISSPTTQTGLTSSGNEVSQTLNGGSNAFELSFTNFDSVQFRQFCLSNQPSLAFDGGSLATFLNLAQNQSESSSESDVSSPDTSNFMDTSYNNSNLRVESVKFEASDSSQQDDEQEMKEEEPETIDMKINFLRSPLVRSKSTITMPSLMPVTRPRSSTYPLPAPSSSQEVLGQIVLKHCQGDDYMDIAPYVTFPQHEAAKRLNMPSSTLSKKWKDATVNRKWPYRTLAKIDKEIATIMHNIHRNSNGIVERESEAQLARLLQQRQAETRPVVVRMN